MAITISRFGITWTIEGSPANGTYANGDPWVVGPITITAISPEPTNGRNGTMINPARGRNQGFDNRISSQNIYDHALNVGAALPLIVPPHSSVVSSVSKSENVTFNQIQDMAILTVVEEAPDANSFRPPYIGDGSRASQWKESDLDYDKLASLARAPLSSVPSISTVADYFSKVWYEQDTTWTGRYLHMDHMASNGYGKEMAIRTGHAALLLNLDFTQEEKRDLLVRFVQYGLDCAGMIEKGGKWTADGSHNPGRLSPVLFAAVVLDDPTIKGYLAGELRNFSELGQTFYVTQEDVDRAPYYSADGRPRRAYIESDIGKPEWGITHYTDPSKDGNNWDSFYRDICGSVMQAPAAAAIVMDAKGLIDHNAFFDYAERHIFYRRSFYAIESYYNGWDDGDAYGQGNTDKAAPFSSNETPGFHNGFYLTYAAWKPSAPFPVADVQGGWYESPRSVALSSVIEADAIHYTLDGTDPTSASPLYTAPIPITESCALKAIAILGEEESEVMEAAYTISTTGEPAPPSNLQLV